MQLVNGEYNLYSLDLTSGTQTQIPDTNFASSITYSRVDGKVVGIATGSNQLVRYDPVNGGYTTAPLVGWPSGESTNAVGGSLDGTKMYVYSYLTNRLRTVDIDPNSSTYGHVLSTVATSPGQGNIPDLAMHPTDGYLYGVDITGHLVRMNPTTGATADLGQKFPADQFGAAYMDDLGDLYEVDNPTGAIYQLNLTASTAASPIPAASIPAPRQVGTTNKTTGNDGAACLRPYDYGDAPDSYGTTKASTGARAIADFDLTLGQSVTAEQDANTPLDGTGDEDDALTTPLPELSPSSTSYQLSVPVHNNKGTPATVAGWVDFNRNGTFDPGERVTATAQPGDTSVQLTWNAPSGVVPGQSYVRLRLYSGTQADPQPTGFFDDAGEVEDYPLTIANDQLAISKAVTPNPVSPGDTATYTVTVKNTGGVDDTGVTVSDDLSGVLDDATLSGSPTASSGTASVNGSRLTWTGDVPVGGTVTITYKVLVGPAGTGDGKLVNSVVGPPQSNCASGSTDSSCKTEDPLAAVEITKTTDNPKPLPGQKVTYTVKVQNTGQVPVSGGSVRDDLSGVLDDATYNQDASDGGAGGSFAYASPVLTWTGDVPVGATVTLTYSATVNDPDTGDRNLNNAITSTIPGNNCTTGSNDPKCSTDANVPQLDITKTVDAPSPAKPGDKVTYTISVTNPGSTDYTGATLSDDLTGVLDDATYNDDATASSGTASYTAPKIAWTGDVPAGGRVAITYSVTVKDPDTGDKKLANAVLGPPGSNCTAGSTDPKCTTATGVAALSIDKQSTSPSPVKPGDTVNYTVTIANTGTADYPNASLSDDLSGVLDDATYNNDAATSNGTVSYTAPKISWTGDVAAGGTATITYSVKVNQPDTGDKKLTNAVLGPPGSNCTTGSTDPKCTTTKGVADLDITKTAAPDPAVAGGKVTYTVKVANTGTADYPGASFSDDLTGVLDDATSNDDATASSGTASYTAPKVSWTGDVAAGKTETITYSVTVKNPDTGDKKLTNAVLGPPGSNCATGSTDPKCTTTTGVGALDIIKTASAPSPAKPGDKVTYTVKVTNTGTATYNAASFVDSLDGVLDDATYGHDQSADTGGAFYTAPQVSWAGDLDAGQTATITYSVTVNNPDTGDKTLTNAIIGPPGSNCEKGSTDPKCGTSTGIADLAIAKSVSPSDPKPGDDVHYTVRVTNTGTAPYPNASLSDDLTKVLDDATYNNDATATGGTATYTAPKLTWSGDLPAGGTATLTYSVTVNSPDTGDKSMINAILGPPGSNCQKGSTDPRCSTVVPAPRYDFGDAPDSYGTTLSHDGARNLVEPGLSIGSKETPDSDGHPSAGADVDSDDDGVQTMPVFYQHDGDYRLPVKVTNRTGKSAVLAGWIDADQNGTFDPGELATATIPPGATSGTLHWTGLGAIKPGRTYLRLRLFGDESTATRAATRALAPVSPTGYGGPGEVEDYSLLIQPTHLQFTKTASTDHPKPGQTVKYTITVANSGPEQYEGASLTDDLTRILDDASYNGDARATTGSTAYRKPELSWRGTVPAGGKAVITYSATIHNPDDGDGRIANAVTGPEGSNCAPGASDLSCSTQGTVIRPGRPAGTLPKTGIGPSAWYLSLGAALLLALGSMLTVAIRRRR